ncbi:hypothetical protein TUM19329_32170 [Legionella antarctica]|uniref:Uncharacterized protein n=1 Tax=Legionella antarctica TaxID=2708020 RepID=A0A6F8TA48_9GAMM|nr:hypothetical protein TUM19329_32170 [Legionella antarctica]
MGWGEWVRNTRQKTIRRNKKSTRRLSRKNKLFSTKITMPSNERNNNVRIKNPGIGGDSNLLNTLRGKK